MFIRDMPITSTGNPALVGQLTARLHAAVKRKRRGGYSPEQTEAWIEYVLHTNATAKAMLDAIIDRVILEMDVHPRPSVAAERARMDETRQLTVPPAFSIPFTTLSISPMIVSKRPTVESDVPVVVVSEKPSE